MEAADFPETARRFFARGGWGANVTVPHKIAATALVDALDPEAALTGAVNTLYRVRGALRGANTDVAGLRRDLLERRGLAGGTARRLVIVGAGGAARAVALALHECCRRIEIVARDPERARPALDALARAGVRVAAVHDLGRPLRFECDLLVDATSAWVRGESWSLPRGAVPEGAVFCTLTYGPEARAFKALAARHAARAVYDGWGLLVEQAAASFALWTGVSPPTEALHRLDPEGPQDGPSGAPSPAP